MNEDAVLPGVIKTLNMLKDKGILIGIGSVSKNTPLILDKTELNKYIDQVSCGLDITRSKLDPEVFEVAAAKLGLIKEECLVVEDSGAGVIAAKAADYVLVLPEEDNIAHGKKVKASSFNDVYTPRKVVDGIATGIS